VAKNAKGQVAQKSARVSPEATSVIIHQPDALRQRSLCLIEKGGRSSAFKHT
jgi:hypothetical protein